MIVPIQGMHCKSCELSIENKIKRIEDISRVSVSHTSGKARIWYGKHKPSMREVTAAVEQAGYTVGKDNPKNWISHNGDTYFFIGCAIAILAFLYMVTKDMGLSRLATGFIAEQSIAMAPIIGLVAGLSSCMALIGGLVLGLSSRHAEIHPEASRWQKFRPHLFFNLGRILGFALLGGLIGLAGKALQPSIQTLSVMTIIVGAVMILLGLKLLELFPILDRVNITLPKFISRLFGFNKDVKEYSHVGSFAAGVASFFLPCGFTQAMQLYAISTGSFAAGALVMSLFAVGTSIGLLGIGGLTSVFKGKARLFFATAGLAVILLGMFNINNASRIVFAGSKTVSNSTASNTETQILNAEFWARPLPDMEPYEFTVKAGQPVKFVVKPNQDGIGCMSTIMIPGLYNKPLALEKNKTVTMDFIPSERGSYPITCAMGVKRGVLRVE